MSDEVPVWAVRTYEDGYEDGYADGAGSEMVDLDGLGDRMRAQAAAAWSEAGQADTDRQRYGCCAAARAWRDAAKMVNELADVAKGAR